jgi:hypothetical protein
VLRLCDINKYKLKRVKTYYMQTIALGRAVQQLDAAVQKPNSDNPFHFD